jgi:sodium transport system ATP-binding protein
MQKMSQERPDLIPAVLADNLSKRFRRNPRWAVRDLSFSCQSGTVTGLLGENGAGKTSTLRMLSTMLNPTEGSATVCGHDTENDPAKVRQRVGMLFGGTSGLYDRLSATENILYFARLNGLGHKEAKERLSELAEVFDMGDFLHRRAGTFSTGMRQKTLIARAIIHNPPVLLLDEPATGLDFSTRRNIHRFILRQKNLGKTIIFSSHDLSAVQEICDTLIVLHNGRLAAKGSPAELSRKGSLESGIEELTRSSK